MKSKALVAIFFFCLPMFNLWGQFQAFAPIGARWHYRPGEQIPDQNLYTFTVTKDTLLGGLTARELACSQWINGQFQDFSDLNKYVHANADSVFYYVDNQWELLFNFDAKSGDTIRSKVDHFEIFNGCMVPNPGQTWGIAYRIDSTGTENIGGSPLRVQYVSSICQSSEECWLMGGAGGTGKIVERIGAINSGYWWGQSGLCLLIFPGYLRCYEDGDIHYKGNIGNTPCGFVTTNEMDDYNISIAPNPTNGNLFFSFPPLAANLNFKVFDGLGRTLERGKLMIGETSLQLQLEPEHSGILYVEFTSNGKTKTYKILKI